MASQGAGSPFVTQNLATLPTTSGPPLLPSMQLDAPKLPGPFQGWSSKVEDSVAATGTSLYPVYRIQTQIRSVPHAQNPNRRI